MEYIAPIFFCVLLWWLGTGVVLRLDRLPQSAYRSSVWVYGLLVFFVLLALMWLRTQTTQWSSYAAFSSALIIWGWMELLHYSGVVMGPRTDRCPAGVSTRQRFWYALQAMLFHEVAIAAGALVLFIMVVDSPNKVALYTYLVLWLMRISAELNVFFGVAYLPEQWLPKRLQYLMSYRGKQRISAFFLLSVLLATSMCVWLFGRMPDVESDVFGHTSLMLVGCLLVLAIIEHWVLVLPIKWFSLWSWAQRRAAL